MRSNLSWITEYLATGGDLSPDPDQAFEQVDYILAQGITLVVDMRREANDAEVWDAVPDGEVTYLHVPTDDAHGYQIPQEAFDAVVVAVREHYQADGAKVLIHCHMGINRGPSGALAVLLDQGYDPVEAYDLIRKARPIAGIAYAVDALKADHRRRRARGQEVSGRDLRDVKRLERHIREVMTPSVQRDIQHKIRELHAKDAEHWKRLAETIRSMR